MSDTIAYVIVYIVGMVSTFSVMCLVDGFDEYETPIMPFFLALIWPVAVPLYLVYLPFHGLSKLIDRIKG